MGEELKPCPFCGGNAERLDVPDEDDVDGGVNAGGSCIQCVRCAASTALHFDRKENLVSSWNSRAALSGMAEPVKVKPLEWSDEGNGEFIAQSVVGSYHISLPASFWSALAPDGEILSGFHTHTEAQAAAQADYERRILSALATPPASGLREENERLREALRKAPDIVAQWAGIHRLRAEEYTARALSKIVYPEVKAHCDAALQTEGK